MIASIVAATIQVLSIAIIIRALLSWFPNIDPRNPAVEFLVTITEPILSPIRRIIPRLGMFDLTPIIALLVLQAVGSLILRNL